MRLLNRVLIGILITLILMGSGGYSFGNILGRSTCNGTTEVVVSTPYVTALSNIFLTEQIPGGTPSGVVYVSSRVAGVSFGFKCAAADTSTVAYMIVEP